MRRKVTTTLFYLSACATALFMSDSWVLWGVALVGGVGMLASIHLDQFAVGRTYRDVA